MAQTQTQISTDLIASISTSTSAVTNFNPGSLIRSLSDAVSAESALMEAEIESQVASGIVNSMFQILPITKNGAVGSTYLLTFTLSSSAPSNKTYAAGTGVIIPNSTLQWNIGQSITVAPGASVSVTATCTTTGTITNVPANTITQLINPNAYTSVTNTSAQPVVAGRDAETQTELQAQVANQVNALHKGDESAVEAAALTSQLTDAAGNPTEQVVKALQVDSTTGGLGYCYVFNGVGPMSTSLLTQTQNIVNGYVDTNGNKIVGAKAAGVFMTVKDAPETVVNVIVSILPKYGYSLDTIQTGVEEAINKYFANLDLGQGISLSQLYFAILAAPGVADADITSPSAPQPSVPYLSAPNAPTLTAVSGSTSLVVGTYYVSCTFVNEWGETTASLQSSVSVTTAGQAIQVSPISLPSGASSVSYYLSTAVGSTTVAYDANGTGAQINLTALPLSGAPSPPVSNTAKLEGNAYMVGTITINPLAPN